MRSRNEIKTLRGIITPLVTPLKSDGELDENGLRRLVDHVIGGGVNGLFLLGTTGEGPSLTLSQRRRVMECACDQAASRVPVLASISDTSLGESLAMARHAESSGVDAVVLVPPFYYPLSPSELTAYAIRIGSALTIPFYLYNAPSVTGASVPESVLRACLELPNFLGLKDSSGDMQYFKRARQTLGAENSRSLFIGPEELLLDSLICGGDGGVAGGSNVWPELYVSLFHATERGDWEKARELQADILRISRNLYSLAGYGSSVVKQIKGLLSIFGICQPQVATPGLQLEREELEAMQDALKSLKVGELPAANARF